MGGCEDVHVYDDITREKVDFILNKLREGNADIIGDTDGPWDIDTHDSGVKLRGEWDEVKSQMSITVTSKNFLVPCSLIWQKIDHLMGKV
ncbi:hypothetical protein [Candidatus Magnetominusculus xianensis]|uniref:Uncharacterized protein n=1 Tax=Candidatus Magnetominusculus xianensis TaxID=1748249 RepID=A0ABR5SIK6_9BACT|nr:hypothetical protein [Candidatus Magnetominusculus xianensis]KWT89593.1 hypothetical protein ASN18_1223 [Candidatus Magnetominusculus xianensis]MBF0405564.1 hypothetical protein [Nitrospirota bacterium]